MASSIQLKRRQGLAWSGFQKLEGEKGEGRGDGEKAHPHCLR